MYVMYDMFAFILYRHMCLLYVYIYKYDSCDSMFVFIRRVYVPVVPSIFHTFFFWFASLYLIAECLFCFWVCTPQKIINVQSSRSMLQRYVCNTGRYVISAFAFTYTDVFIHI